jgi:hypothetical protein
MTNNLDEVVQSGYDIAHQMEKAGIPTAESTVKAAARLFRRSGIYPMTNLAVCVCDAAFAQEGEKALKDGKSPEMAKHFGKVAYCAALPKLTGARDIRDFVACVTHGIAMEILPGNDGTRLLYAAQVAVQAQKKRPLKRGKEPVKTAPKTDENSLESTQ